MSPNRAILNRVSPPTVRTRREFLRRGAVSLAALPVFGERLLADPYAGRVPHRMPWTPVRIRGRVTASGRPVPNAGVSDGISVIATGADGRFELVSGTGKGFLSLIPPRGYALPTSGAGTLLLHRPILPDGSGEMRSDFTLDPASDDEHHVFLVLADPQTQDEYEMGRFHAETVPDVQGTVSTLGLPCFGVGCGDLMFDRLDLFPEYERAVSRMGIPFCQVVGNHDLDQDGASDAASVATFSRHFGPNRYAFNRGNVHYVVLDDVFWHGADYLGHVDGEQLEWLAADLALVERGGTVVVFLHIPVYTSISSREQGSARPDYKVAVTNREALYRLLEPYRAHIYSGHTHESDHIYEGGVHEYTVGAVCGAWWSGDICYDGTPNGYGVFEVRGEEIRGRYKATGQPAAHQLRAYSRGADPTAPEEIVANVWNWDPAWTVVWYQGADRRGAMARRTGLDPLSVAQHLGPDLPERRKWVDPVRTDHMFYAPVAAGATDLRVEAVDGWGGRYEQPVRGEEP